MMTAAQISAARQYAPPLITIGQADRRGARLRTVNRQAIDYVKNAGLDLDDVYPGWPAQVHDLAGVGAGFSGESAPAGRRWGWAAVGFAVGAMAGGPIWALAGGVLGALQ